MREFVQCGHFSDKGKGGFFRRCAHGLRRKKQFVGGKNLPEYSKQNISKKVLTKIFPFFSKE